MIIAVDFDGTCVAHDFPYIGKDIGAVPVLQALVNNGHQIMLWTMRDHSQTKKFGFDVLDIAVDWFKTNNIPLWGINKNKGQHWSNSPKQFAHWYIDDMALGCPLKQEEGFRDYVDWEAIARLLVYKGLLEPEQYRKIYDQL